MIFHVLIDANNERHLKAKFLLQLCFSFCFFFYYFPSTSPMSQIQWNRIFKFSAILFLFLPLPLSLSLFTRRKFFEVSLKHFQLEFRTLLCFSWCCPYAFPIPEVFNLFFIPKCIKFFLNFYFNFFMFQKLGSQCSGPFCGVEELLIKSGIIDQIGCSERNLSIFYLIAIDSIDF